MNDAVITLGDEIISNIDFTKEHLKQVKNMLYLTEQVVNEFNTITLKEAYQIHTENPYIFSIIENGEIEYNTRFQDNYFVLVGGMPGNQLTFFFNQCYILENY